MFLFFIISSLFTIPNDSIQAASNIHVYTTESQSNIKLVESNAAPVFTSIQQPKEVHSGIFVNPKVTFQTFVGIGAALTDAAAETFYKLNKDQQEIFLDSYFSKDKGIGYTLVRTIIHSCDFSTESYTYIEEGDESLESFSI
ncbi:MAG: glycosyl hydrolase, partial [Rhodospirillaceae bacterium TMED63]